MRFRTEAEVLAEATATAGRAVSNRPSPNATSGLLFVLAGDTLTITGTDLDLTILVDVDVAGERDGKVVVPARLAVEVLRGIGPGKLEIDLVDETMHIVADRSNFDLRTILPDDFPRIAASAAEPVVLPAEAFAEAIRQVERAASSDENRQQLTGVLLAADGNGLRLVATDSYRLAMRVMTGAEVLGAGQQVLLPARALRELARLLPGHEQVELRLGEQNASFQVDGRRLLTRLLDDRFPPYEQLIPKSHPYKLLVGREALLDALKRLRPLASGSVSPNVQLRLEAERVQLVARDERGQAVDDIDARFDGEPFTVAFNPNFLADGVEAVHGDQIVIELLDAMKPAVVRAGDGGDYTYLLMPVRVP